MDCYLSATSSAVIDTIAVRLCTDLYFMSKYRYIILVANSYLRYIMFRFSHL